MPSAVINVVITLWLLCGKYMLCTVLEIADYSHSSMDGLGWVEWVAISMLKRQVQSAIDAGRGTTKTSGLFFTWSTIILLGSGTAAANFIYNNTNGIVVTFSSILMGCPKAVHISHPDT